MNNIVQAVEYKGLSIKVTEEISGYGFAVNGGPDSGIFFGTPAQTASTYLIYDTPEIAIAQAKRAIEAGIEALEYGDDD